MSQLELTSHDVMNIVRNKGYVQNYKDRSRRNRDRKRSGIFGKNLARIIDYIADRLDRTSQTVKGVVDELIKRGKLAYKNGRLFATQGARPYDVKMPAPFDPAQADAFSIEGEIARGVEEIEAFDELCPGAREWCLELSGMAVPDADQLADREREIVWAEFYSAA